MKLEIYFAGLICLEGTETSRNSNRNAKTRATLVDDADHTPYICINGQDHELAARSRITFEHTLFGQAKALGFIQNALPHLATLTRSNVELNHESLGVHVRLPSGDLTVASVYDDGARYTLDGNITTIPCVANMTLLTIESRRDEKITVNYTDLNGDQTYEFQTDDWILIENAGGMSMPDHFKKYSKLTTGSSSDIADYEEISKGDCGDIEPGDHVGEALEHVRAQHPSTAAQPECAGSLWP